ncbi:MAG: hypothetical protein U9O94_02190 [Nanoarchaeota archaeon]|nr:hypothetical protein [Nanoarchaeota archaeon]
MAMWALDNIKKMIGRTCGDPEAITYADAIQDHFINAIESLAEDIVAIKDLNRALNDEEREQYAEVLAISENEIYPMVNHYVVNPLFSNHVALIDVNDSGRTDIIRVRYLDVNPQSNVAYTFKELNSLEEMNRIKKNPHLRPSENEIAWVNNGNKIFVYWISTDENSRVPEIYMYCLLSSSYDDWRTDENIQELGFGTNFIGAAIKRASYTMRLQLGFEKE